MRISVPLVHGAIWGLLGQGQVTFLSPPEPPCLQCIVPEAPAKSIFPVVGVTPGLVGCIQAMEVLKYLTGVGENLRGRVLFVDGEDMTFRLLKVPRSPTCPTRPHLV